MKSGVNYVVVLVSVTQENWMWSTAGYFEGRPPLGAPLNRGTEWPEDAIILGAQRQALLWGTGLEAQR